jgi:hypothetical protein
MEQLSPLGCESWRDAIADDAFNQLDPGRTLGLRAHLEGCSTCRAVSAEMHETHAALAFADPDAVAESGPVPSALSEHVLRTLRRNGRAARQRRGAAAFATAAVAVLVAVGVLHLVTSGPTAPTSRAISLVGGAGAHGSAVLTAESWGSSLQLHEWGASRGLYTVNMESDQGTWWVAGTFQVKTDGAVEITMGCAVPENEVAVINVRDTGGHVVLSSGEYT